MIGYLKRMYNAFQRALELDRILREYSDPAERRQVLLAVIHGKQGGAAQDSGAKRRWRQARAA